MKLNQINEAMWPSYGKRSSNLRDITIYVTLQGVLADVKQALRRAKTHWTNTKSYETTIGTMHGNPEHFDGFFCDYLVDYADKFIIVPTIIANSATFSGTGDDEFHNHSFSMNLI